MLISIRFKERRERHRLAKKFLNLDGQKFEIAYEMLLHQKYEWIVFLHGWGSNKEVMRQAFGECFADFNHLYIDLPGFGQSQNAITLNTNRYAQIVRVFLDSIGINEAIIVGHSFGGKVATLLNPKELVLLSSAGIVCPKSFKVRCKIYLAKILKRLGVKSKSLRSSDANGLNEAMYQTFKNVVDEDFSPLFISSSSQAYIFWGEQDRSTPLESGKTIASLIKKSYFLALKGDHYFFLNQGKIIEDHILSWRIKR